MIVIDTHIWLWWTARQEERLPSGWFGRIQSAESVGVSAVSLLEVAMLTARGRIALGMDVLDWFERASTGQGIEVVPLSGRISARAAGLPQHHKDPFDRVIIATALESGTSLMSVDSHFKRYDELRGVLLDSPA